MRLLRMMAAVLLAATAACTTAPADMTASSTLLIDQPTAPYPYNSRFCP